VVGTFRGWGRSGHYLTARMMAKKMRRKKEILLTKRAATRLAGFE
jgi:hypothetical protein